MWGRRGVQDWEGRRGGYFCSWCLSLRTIVDGVVWLVRVYINKAFESTIGIILSPCNLRYRIVRTVSYFSPVQGLTKRTDARSALFG